MCLFRSHLKENVSCVLSCMLIALLLDFALAGRPRTESRRNKAALLRPRQERCDAQRTRRTSAEGRACGIITAKHVAACGVVVVVRAEYAGASIRVGAKACRRGRVRHDASGCRQREVQQCASETVAQTQGAIAKPKKSTYHQSYCWCYCWCQIHQIRHWIGCCCWSRSPQSPQKTFLQAMRPWHACVRSGS